MKTRVILFFFLGGCFFSCKKDDLDTQVDPNPQVENTDANQNNDAGDITDDPGNVNQDPGESEDPGQNTPNHLFLDLVNTVRANGCSCGGVYKPAVAPLMWSALLENAAQRHSVDMAVHQNLSHTGSDGSSMIDRVNDSGFDWSFIGENVAVNSGDEQAVMQAWLNSTPHCNNIMNPNYTHLGAAQSGAYWTQVFAAY